MWGSSMGMTRSSSESIRSNQVLPLRDDPKIQANRPGAVTEMSGMTPSGTLPLLRWGYLQPQPRRGRSIGVPSNGTRQARPDQQDETDQDADDAERVVDEHGNDDPDNDE